MTFYEKHPLLTLLGGVAVLALTGLGSGVAASVLHLVAIVGGSGAVGMGLAGLLEGAAAARAEAAANDERQENMSGLAALALDAPQTPDIETSFTERLRSERAADLDEERAEELPAGRVH